MSEPIRERPTVHEPAAYIRGIDRLLASLSVVAYCPKGPEAAQAEVRVKIDDLLDKRNAYLVEHPEESHASR